MFDGGTAEPAPAAEENRSPNASLEREAAVAVDVDVDGACGGWVDDGLLAGCEYDVKYGVDDKDAAGEAVVVRDIDCADACGRYAPEEEDVFDADLDARSAKTSGFVRWVWVWAWVLEDPRALELELEVELREESVGGLVEGAEDCQRSAKESAMVCKNS